MFYACYGIDISKTCLYAYSRYLTTKQEIEEALPKRGGKTPTITIKDFSGKSSLFLREESQFDYLVKQPIDDTLSEKIAKAMELIEEDYPKILQGQLPKEEYKKINKDLLHELLNKFDDSELKNADGDIFGRIYEYFLSEFANLSAHDNGEFLTLQSLVQMIVNVIEPEFGTVLDPACGTAGMFVQSAHFIERLNKDPNKVLTFKGQEKNETTIRLAKMNLAVHGLGGEIEQGITYYEDKHDLFQKAEYVMANPPFNVDEIDADKVKNDPRLPFGLPGVNKKQKIGNGNYVWISYFYSYLNEKGRAGFVMSSQASSAGNSSAEDKSKIKTEEKDGKTTTTIIGKDEALIRKNLIETKHVDVMISIRSNFFYTRSVPCELWFFDKGKPNSRLDKVLMIDARNVYRQVTRKINDFSPEQLQNLSSIVWLYRGQNERFLQLVNSYQEKCISFEKDIEEINNDFISILNLLFSKFEKFIKEAKISISKNSSYTNYITQI